MDTRKSTAFGILIALIGAAAVVAAVFVGGGAASAAAPPWAVNGASQDGLAVGGLEFFDAAGTPITSGSIGTVNGAGPALAAYVVGLTAPRSDPDTKASVFAFRPNSGQTPDLWSDDQQLSLSSVFHPNPGTAPGAIGTTTLPFNTGASTDTTLASFASQFPITSTQSGYVNVYEIRLYTSGPGDAPTTYDFADVTVDLTNGAWTLDFTPAGTPLPTGGATTAPTTPTDTPTTPSDTPTDTPTTPTDTPTDTPTTPTDTPTDTPTTPTDTPTTPTDTPTTPTDTPTTPTDTPTTPTDTPTTPSNTPTSPPDTSTDTAISTPSGTPTSGASTAASGSVRAVDADGSPLPSNPTLQPGDSVNVTIGGLTPGHAYSVTLHSTPMNLGTVNADSTGQVVFALQVPATLAAGAHTLQFADSTGTVVGSFAFTFSGASAIDATQASAGSLAFTGTDFSILVLGGLAAFGIGAFVILAGRRRLHGKHL